MRKVFFMRGKGYEVEDINLPFEGMRPAYRSAIRKNQGGRVHAEYPDVLVGASTHDDDDRCGVTHFVELEDRCDIIDTMVILRRGGLNRVQELEKEIEDTKRFIETSTKRLNRLMKEYIEAVKSGATGTTEESE